jgi:hypothetical protein
MGSLLNQIIFCLLRPAASLIVMIIKYFRGKPAQPYLIGRFSIGVEDLAGIGEILS